MQYVCVCLRTVLEKSKQHYLQKYRFRHFRPYFPEKTNKQTNRYSFKHNMVSNLQKIDTKENKRK